MYIDCNYQIYERTWRSASEELESISMASAVIDIEFTKLPDSLEGFSKYQKAFILIRYAGYPVGKCWLPIQNGRISRDELEAGMLKNLGESFWQRWAESHFQISEKYPHKTSLTATIAICTRDRPEDLQNCLEGVTKLLDSGQEVMVIDNNPSNHATLDVVRSFTKVRYIQEDRRGLDIARNRALREARTDIVAFIDDDAYPDQNWLNQLLVGFLDPQVMCVTGLTMPMELETEAQELFEIYGGFGRGFQRKEYSRLNFNPLFAGQVGAGANMALRRSVIAEVGLFDEALDAGTPTFSGGDSDMACRILMNGYKIVYEPAALNWHRHRRSLVELRRVIYGYGVGVYAMLAKQFLIYKRFGVFRVMLAWFLQGQLPGLFFTLINPSEDRLPAIYHLDELRGCLAGPSAYLASKRFLRQQTGVSG